MVISPEEAKNIMETEDNIVILDVRTEEEYNEKHIPNTILISLDKLSNIVEEKIKDKNKKILVYCRSGKRSKIATQILLKKGYKNVLDFGGIMNWRYEVEN